MAPGASSSQCSDWLLESGPAALERLFRAVVFDPYSPILIADDNGKCLEVSAGAARLLGLSSDEIAGRKLAEFLDPGFAPQLAELWTKLLATGHHEGSLRMVSAEGVPREVASMATGNVLPGRHVFTLRDTTGADLGAPANSGEGKRPRPATAPEMALLLLYPDGRIAGWHERGTQTYGYSADQLRGSHVSVLYPVGDSAFTAAAQELNRAAEEDHFWSEGWHLRQDGSRFWADVITVGLRDGSGQLQGFARIVRDFSERHEADDKLRRSRGRVCPLPLDRTRTAVVSGEFDRIAEANDASLI